MTRKTSEQPPHSHTAPTATLLEWQPSLNMAGQASRVRRITPGCASTATRRDLRQYGGRACSRRVAPPSPSPRVSPAPALTSARGPPSDLAAVLALVNATAAQAADPSATATGGHPSATAAPHVEAAATVTDGPGRPRPGRPAPAHGPGSGCDCGWQACLPARHVATAAEGTPTATATRGAQSRHASNPGCRGRCPRHGRGRGQHHGHGPGPHPDPDRGHDHDHGRGRGPRGHPGRQRRGWPPRGGRWWRAWARGTPTTQTTPRTPNPTLTAGAGSAPAQGKTTAARGFREMQHTRT
jgi:hypothetical protein